MKIIVSLYCKLDEESSDDPKIYFAFITSTRSENVLFEFNAGKYKADSFIQV